MKAIELGVCLILLAAGAGWAAWLTSGYRPDGVTAAGLGLGVGAALIAYMASDRKDAGVWLRFGLYGAGLAVCAASLWTGLVRPLQSAGSFGAAMAWLKDLDGLGLVLLAVPPPALMLLTVLWFEVAVGSVKYLDSGRRRRRAESDLHGHALAARPPFPAQALEEARHSARPVGRGRNARLIGWSLEGSAITVAPPRAGKGATIALNLLSPDDRGFQGSTVTIDPRGELWCIAARRRRQMGRNVLLLDPFGVVAGHKEAFPKCHLPDVTSATYNPLEFIRKDESLAVRDINVLLDALLTPPRPDAHQNSRHFYESARAIIAGYMAWVRFKAEPPQRSLATLYRMLSMTPEEWEAFAGRVLDTDRFAGGLTHIAVERQAQVGREEGGSTFTTVANQFAFLNYPELLAHTAASSFDPLDLAKGDTDLFVVAPEETIEHVKGWLRLWVAIPNAVAGIQPLERDLLIVIDEMPRLGYLKPVMDGYTMAAGKGVHFWCFAQSISAPRFELGQGTPQDAAAPCRGRPGPGFPEDRRRGRRGALQGHRHRHLRGPHREPFGHHRREPHRHRQYPVAGGRLQIPGPRASGHPRRVDDSWPGPPVRDRGRQGHAARRTPSPSRPLLAPPRRRLPRRSKPVRAAQATRGGGRVR